MINASKVILAGAALAGLLAGANGATFASSVPAKLKSSLDPQGTKDQSGSDSKVKKEKHACKGKNSCKGKGGCKVSDNGCKGKNTCKGKGGCATDGSKKQ